MRANGTTTNPSARMSWFIAILTTVCLSFPPDALSEESLRAVYCDCVHWRGHFKKRLDAEKELEKLTGFPNKNKMYEAAQGYRRTKRAVEHIEEQIKKKTGVAKDCGETREAVQNGLKCFQYIFDNRLEIE